MRENSDEIKTRPILIVVETPMVVDIAPFEVTGWFHVLSLCCEGYQAHRVGQTIHVTPGDRWGRA